MIQVEASLWNDVGKNFTENVHEGDLSGRGSRVDEMDTQLD